MLLATSCCAASTSGQPVRLLSRRNRTASSIVRHERSSARVARSRLLAVSEYAKSAIGGARTRAITITAARCMTSPFHPAGRQAQLASRPTYFGLCANSTRPWKLKWPLRSVHDPRTRKCRCDTQCRPGQHLLEVRIGLGQPATHSISECPGCKGFRRKSSSSQIRNYSFPQQASAWYASTRRGRDILLASRARAGCIMPFAVRPWIAASFQLPTVGGIRSGEDPGAPAGLDYPATAN